MKILLSLFAGLLFLGAGCQSPNTAEPQVLEVITTPTYSMDVTQWQQASLGPDVRFSYPSEFVYSTGGDIDEGSYSWVQTGEQDTIVFTLFRYAMLKCTEENLTKCNLGTVIIGTPEEVFADTVEAFTQDASYKLVGDVGIGNTTGVMFVSLDTNLSTILFKGTQGVYRVMDMQTQDDTGELFDLFLSTFEVR